MHKNNESIISQFFDNMDWEGADYINNLLVNHNQDSPISSHEGYQEAVSGIEFKPVQSSPSACNDVLNEIENIILPGSINMGSPLFIGHMTTLLPNFTKSVSALITAMNQNIVKIETSKVLTHYERIVISQMHQLIFGESDEVYSNGIIDSELTFGAITAGGTTANVMALHIARNKAVNGIAEQGLNTLNNKSVVICSELAHYSIKKAMDVLGLGINNLVTIPVNDHQKINLKILKSTIAELRSNDVNIIALVGIAGSTECGSVDPLEEIGQIAQVNRIHFHVDAAWGGGFIFSDEHKHLLRGIELANSVTLDPHKQLYVPMGIGMLLFKDTRIADNVQHTAQYTIRKNSFDLGQRTHEGSRPANSLYLYTAIKLMGKEGYEELINTSLNRTLELKSIIDNSEEFEMISEPQLNILLYQYIPEKYRGVDTLTLDEAAICEINSFNENLQTKQFNSGKSFVSRTTLTIKSKSKYKLVCLRVVMANPMTKTKHLNQVIQHQKTIAMELETSVLFENYS
ncbi:MAG: aminotransferase class V-fold PLP-dependent enzyme [Flavobacteriales bacterium]|nr:aminotransferase class V-fold PLP-dependent enzyme [Flavobacteriales bacterium]